MFKSFPSIESFYHVRKNVEKYDWPSKVTYRAKIKLHGTNAAVQILPNGTVLAQSRTRIINPQDDNMGFAAFVESTKNHWSYFATSQVVTVFGEWFGKGIMKGVACSEVDGKYFAPFAVQVGDGEDAVWLTDQKSLLTYANSLNILPLIFTENTLEVDFNSIDESVINQMNALVEKVEKCDPFIERLFGIEGTGEGVVFYPVAIGSDSDIKSRELYRRYMFKAKGEKHKTVKTRNAVQVDPEVAASIEEFANKVVTEARMEQAVRESNGGELEFDMKKIGPYIAWLSKDVKKETEEELQASGLTWKQVQKAISSKAVAWYKSKFET